MSTQSLDAFLKEMAKEPQTHGWDAVLVFDRKNTNILLMQEYIDRFDGDSYFPPFERSEIDIAENIKHALEGLVLDKPRLSFENADISDSLAKLTMRMVGGKQIQLQQAYRDGKPVKTATRVSSLNAVVAPSLLMDIKLLQVPGTVDAEGKVLLDLSKGSNHYFSGVETDFEAEKLGIHFKGIFDGWNEKFREFQLSELAQSDESVLEPGNFGVRTHAEPGAKVRGAANEGEGAVVVFVAMKGRPNGRYPAGDSDMLYMLPWADEPYSSNLLLGHEFLLEGVLLPVLNNIPGLQNSFKLVNELGDSKRKQLVATEGGDGFTIPGWRDSVTGGNLNPWQASYTAYLTKIPAVSGDGLRFYMEDSKLKGRWQSSGHRGKIIGSSASDTVIHPFEYEYEISINVSFFYRLEISIDAETGKPTVVSVLEGYDDNFTVVLHGGEDTEFGRKFAERISGIAVPVVESVLRPFYNELLALSVSIDAFRLNNLLFRGNNVVTPRDAYLPTDITLLGDLAPDRTGLVVSPAEVVVPAGRTQKFTASLSDSTTSANVQWSVENLPGESGETGRIDPSSGLYTAPSAASLHEDGFRRVIVTATQSGMTSKSLVSLVEHEVSVYPLVLVAQLGNQYSLAAGTADSAVLEWSMGGAGLGTIVDDPDRDPSMQEGRKYIAPNSLPDPRDEEPLSYFAARLDQVMVVPQAGGTAQAIDVLVVGPQSGSYWLEAEAQAGNAVKLNFYRQPRTGPKELVPVGDTEWHLFKGDGTLVDGLYTPKADSAELYAIVFAFYDDGESVDRFAYMIVPVPFVSAERFVELLSPTTQEV